VGSGEMLPLGPGECPWRTWYYNPVTSLLSDCGEEFEVTIFVISPAFSTLGSPVILVVRGHSVRARASPAAAAAQAQK
jgi:hypothetical protein